MRFQLLHFFLTTLLCDFHFFFLKKLEDYRHVSNYIHEKKEDKRKLGKKKEEKIIFLYFCTQKVKKKEKNHHQKRGYQLKRGSLT